MSAPGLPCISTVDEDGFICLVVADLYEGFVGADWQLDDLLTRFTEQMNRGALFVAYGGPDAAGVEVRIVEERSSQSAKRETVGVIDATDGGVWLTDYTQLTMAAQFDDDRPAPDDPGSRLPLPVGRHRIVLRELVSGEATFFELVIAPAGIGGRVTHAGVPWFQ